MPISLNENGDNEMQSNYFCVETYFTYLHLGNKANESYHTIRKDQLDEYIQVLQNAIDAEVTRSTSRDSELEAKIETDVAAAVASIVDMAPDALNTLNEIAAALGDDSNVAANLNSEISNILNRQASDKLELESKIDEERARAEAAEAALNNSLATETTTRISDIATLRSEIEAADMNICDGIKNAKDRSEAAETDFETRLNSEISQRIAEDSLLRSDMEVSDTQLQSNLDAETTRALTAESEISNALSAETANRIADISTIRSEFNIADNTLEAKIDAEKHRAENKESNLQSQITVETSTRAAVDAAHEARMSEEESARRTADENLENQIMDETLRATTAEANIQTALDSEISERTQEVLRIENKEDQNRLDILQILSDESAARFSKDSVLESEIENENHERTLALNALESDKLDRVSGVGEGTHDFEQVTIRGVGVGETVYVTFGKWRIATSDGKDLLFQYNESDTDVPSWKTAVPFIICSGEQASIAASDTDTILTHNYELRSHFDTKLDDSGATFRRHIATNLEGNVLVVGGPYQDNTSEDRGEAYIFTYDSFTNTWSSVELLPSSNDTARFGYSVDINDAGTRIVIGAPHHDIQKGRAYVFDYDGSDWNETAILESDPITIGDNLSYRVSMSGDGNRIAASATGYDIVGDGPLNSHNDVGATYVFDYDVSAWSQTAKLLTEDPTHNEVVGTEMKMSKDGTTIVAGSYYSNVDNNPFAGAAYVFKEVSGVWSQSTKLYDSTPRPLDFYSFTADVTRDGNKVVVGVFGDDLTEITGHPGTSSDYGSLFIYNYDGSVWAEEDKIDASDKFDYTRLQFGGSVSINDGGDTIAVGAIVVDGEPYYNGGTYIYKKIDGIWTEKQKIVTDTPDKGAYDAFFSYDLAFNGSGSKLFITAIMSSSVGTFDRIFNYNLA